MKRERDGRLAALALLCLLIGCGTQPSVLISATSGTHLVTPTATALRLTPPPSAAPSTQPSRVPTVAPSATATANQGHTSAMPSHSTGLPTNPPSASPPSGSPAAATVEVRIIDFAFDPPLVTIPVGTTVVWILAQGYHTVLSPDQRFNSPIMEQVGDRYTYTFTEAGDYDYICGIHPDMLGKVVVTK